MLPIGFDWLQLGHSYYNSPGPDPGLTYFWSASSLSFFLTFPSSLLMGYAGCDMWGNYLGYFVYVIIFISFSVSTDHWELHKGLRDASCDLLIQVSSQGEGASCWRTVNEEWYFFKKLFVHLVTVDG